ncbi:class I SAM-dependent methyltransferase [Alkaliphilus transvaalensis]|uniref:class I SAM-dependent methyltransferase n=1 Tax=Alkaliphilus transvaalensis TaxID=114628 RepID=UPI00068799B0|nr:class I SAM-dependent methyltransferase [Alkaliphilus transvaalensis]
MDEVIKLVENWWDKISLVEELDYDDEYINRQLRWREIEPLLVDVKTILDIGGATGAFSIPLAKMGFKVTHVDISDSMLEVARSNATKKEVSKDNIHFVKADARNLHMFKDNEFDLVLNFDGPISFSGDEASNVIAESCRVTKKKLLISVSNKACMVATWLNYSMQSLGDISRAVEEMALSGVWDRSKYNLDDHFTTISKLRAFTATEIKDELEKNQVKVKHARSIGSLSHLYLLHLYRQMPSEEVKEAMNKICRVDGFIDLCEKFDKEVMPNGPGSFRRAGLIALAEKCF